MGHVDHTKLETPKTSWLSAIVGSAQCVINSTKSNCQLHSQSSIRQVVAFAAT